jgi:hypothetical protein
VIQMPTKKLTPIAFGVIAALAWFALATKNASAQADANAEKRPLSISFGQTISQDSNVFRLSDSASVPSVYGNSSKSDIISRTYGAVSYDNIISKQQIQLRADLDLRRYNTYSQLNRNIYGLSAAWNGNIDRSIYGAANIGYSSTATEFFDQTGLSNNQIKTQQLGATLGYRFTPTWSAFTRFDLVNRNNSALSLRTSDSDSLTFEMGARFEPESGLSGELSVRKRSVDYVNPQIVPISGTPTSFSNSFVSDQVVAKVGYSPNAISSFTGQIGATKLNFDQLTQRNTSGYLANLKYAYRFSDALNLGATLSKDVANDAVSFSSPITVTRMVLDANWRPTGRISIGASHDNTKRDFSSDPSVIAGTNLLKSDRIQSTTVAGRYELLRTVFFTTSITRQSRSAPVASAVFNNTLVTFGVDIRLD